MLLSIKKIGNIAPQLLFTVSLFLFRSSRYDNIIIIIIIIIIDQQEQTNTKIRL